MKPKITIITINYNNLEGLEKTVMSIKNQTYQEFEYLVIDGGSADGSAEFLEKNNIFFNYYVSEPDNGVYHAMNKGIKKATGEYILFLNSGDHFYNSKVLEQNVKFIKDNDLIYFNLQVVKGNKNYIKKYPDTLSFSYFVKDTLPHPATFIKKEVFKKCGHYDEDMKIAADWKLFMDAICKHQFSYVKIDNTMSTFYMDGMSSKSENRNTIYSEKQSILKSDYSAYLQDLEDVIEFRTIINSLRNSRTIKLLVKLKILSKF